VAQKKNNLESLKLELVDLEEKKSSLESQKREDDSRKKVIEHQSGQEELASRRYNKLYREHWQNRTRMERKNVKN